MCLNLQTYIENLVREAYANWNSLEMVETALLTQGILYLVFNFSGISTYTAFEVAN